jgi:hypothetical protein
MGNNKMIVSVLTAISMIFLFCNFSFAASTISLDGSVKYSDTSNLTPTDIDNIVLTETTAFSFSDGGGYFTLKIPSDVKICNIGSNTTQDTSITRSTTILGSVAAPKSLYVLGAGFSASGSPTIYFSSYDSNNYSILEVSILADGSVGFGITGGTQYVTLADWGTLSTSINVVSGEIGTVKIGEIYFDDTTQETVITFAAKGIDDSSYLEKISINGLKLKPSMAKTTGDVNINISNGNANGVNALGVSNHSVKVMTLVTQSVLVSGTVSPSTVPLIAAAKVAAQPMGVLKLNFIADPSVNTSSTISFTLDNGAKFHTSANYNIINNVQDNLASSQTNGDFVVNASGQLVWTIANPQNEIDASDTFQFNADSKMIDTSGITSNGTITCTITGTGAFAGYSGTVTVATVALTDTIVSFIDNNSPGVTTLYAGMDNQELASGEYVLVGEKAPGSMFAGGTITVTLSSGAKFKATTSLLGKYTDATYQSSSFSASGGPNNNSNSFTTTLSGASSGSLGAFTVGLNASNWLDLTNATAGALQMTFSGTAGASGVVTIATIVATTTSKTWYYDSDGDGYGNPSSSISSATQPTGYVANKTDCNDNSASVHPGATEIPGDGIDQDCNGSDLTTSKTWYYDSDGDGYGDPSNSITSATQPNGYVSDKTDCNDNDATVHPNAAEIAGDNIDQNCDGKDAVNTGIWYYDSDGDGYGDPNDSLAVSAQPKGYVSDNTDCNDTDATIYPGATEIAGDGIDQDCNGSDLTVTGAEQISLLAPANNETISFGASGGKIAFSFSKIASAAKYMLHFKLNDIINNTSSTVPVELIPPVSSDPLNIFGGGIIGTPGFSESFIGMVYELVLDTTTWDVLALYNIEWGIEAYDSSGALIGSSYKSSVPSKYASNIKFLASTAIALTSPSPGAEFVKSDPAPVFKWALYTGATQFELILAHVSGASFDQVIPFPNLILNLLTMDDVTWQAMSTGKWYWTVLGYDSMGNPMPSKFTIFDFEVQ